MSEEQPTLPGTAPTWEDIVDLRLQTNEEAIALIKDYLTGPNLGGPWFRELLDADQQRKLLDETTDFVMWLDRTYIKEIPRYKIPSCWWQHPNVVEQMVALMVSHRATYSKKSRAVSMALVEWHERALWPVLERIKKNDSLAQCESAHKPEKDRTRYRMVVEPELATYLGRDESAAPEDGTPQAPEPRAEFEWLDPQITEADLSAGFPETER